MTWWERRGFNIFHAIVAITGIVYLFMKYGMMTEDPFAIINHPWQPSMLSAHIVAAPAFIAFFGMLFRSHTFGKIRSLDPSNRRTGWTSLLTFLTMALSGYGIQIASVHSLITGLIWAHIATSILFVFSYSIHLVQSWTLTKRHVPRSSS